MTIKRVDFKYNNILDFFKKKFANIKFLKKYNYEIDKVIGVKGDEKYILYTDKKLIRIYRGPLKSIPLINSYIPIENAIFYDFEIEKNILSKIGDIEKFIETKIYEETGIDETDKYIFKYKIVDSLSNEKKVMIETVIVSESLIKNKFEYILKETGYIDYLSFPAFSYKSLYQEKILEIGNDVFIVVLEDKIFITFYSQGELLKISTISGGLDKIFDNLSKLSISNFDREVFRKLLVEKGIDEANYSPAEFIVYNELSKNFNRIASIIEEQTKKILDDYNINGIDRVFITTKYGNINGLDRYFTQFLGIETFDFEFYKRYNLDELPIDPLLFLGMLETHYAYKYNDFNYNFSIFLRKPTLFYRPSGQFVVVIILSILLFSLLPLYLYIDGLILNKKNKQLENQLSKLNKEIAMLTVRKTSLEKQKKSFEKIINKLVKDIKRNKTLIKKVYEFKYSYNPKSQLLTDIGLFFNKNNVYLRNLSYERNSFIIDVFAKKDFNIANLIEDLVKNGFDVYTTGIKLNGDNNYTSKIRIKE
jgi:hypothetical protein